MKISSGVDTQELLAVLGKGGYLSVGGAPLKEILTRLEQAEKAEARVRELHSVIPVKVNFEEFTTDYCDFCGDQEYPCPTIRALDGDTRG